MPTIKFLRAEEVDDKNLIIAVILSRCEGKWVFGRQRGETTWEVPAGHREPGESISEAAERELWEETGATDYELFPIGPYSVSQDGEGPAALPQTVESGSPAAQPTETGSEGAPTADENGSTGYGFLFYAHIARMGPLPPYEIEETRLWDAPPADLTYPDVQPAFIAKITEMIEDGRLPG